jgi:DNA-binding NtrC family response regulator
MRLEVGGMKRILILDDERSITFSLSKCLQSDQVQVICCNDSSSAREVLWKKPIDAVIADVRLSASNPYEILDFIQHVRTRHRNIPLIMMSGTEELKTETMQEGADYFFQKPFDVDELLGLLLRLGLNVATPQGSVPIGEMQS